MKNNGINHFDITLNINELNNNQSILSSIFTYYNGPYNIIAKQSNTSNKTNLTNNFINLMHSKKIYIIDYANVIHILYNHYQNIKTVISLFYTFVYKHLLLNNTIFIVSKNVTISNIKFNFNIQTVFNMGKKITALIIPNHYFEKEKINIYNLHYKNKNKISSSSDDLLGHFICFNLFVYLFKNNKKPENKIIFMTNDKQNFNKNLFGTTYDEDKFQIDFHKDIIIQKLHIINNKYILVREKLDEYLITNFYKEYVITYQDDTKDMECIIISLIELLININRNNKLYTGKYYIQQNINKNFTRKKFIKKNINFTYNQLNKLFTNAIEERNKEINCIFNNIKNITYSNGNLKKTYYLYAYIKYIQSFLHKSDIHNHKSKILYDFYGNVGQNEIIINFSPYLNS
jgi:hypothetical protein